MKATSLEDARTKIHDLKLKEIQAQEARRKAGEFANPLFDMEPVRAENFDKVAKEQGLTVHVTAPFDRENGPKELEVGQDFTTRAFARTPDDPFAGPFLGRDAAYVIALKKKLPSEIPPLDQIRSQVVADYKEEQARTLAINAGMTFYHDVSPTAWRRRKTFSAICAGAKEEPVTLPPISISSRDLPEVEEHLTLNQFKQAAFSTPPGNVSPFQVTSDGAMILYVKSKLPLDQDRMIAALPSFINYVRQSRQSEAFNEWFGKQASIGLRDTPLRQPRPAPTLTPGAKSKKT